MSYCAWEDWCCGNGEPVDEKCFSLRYCGCKQEPHPAHYRSLDGQIHPNDRKNRND